MQIDSEMWSPGVRRLASQLNLLCSDAAISLRPSGNGAFNGNGLILFELSPFDARSTPMETRRGSYVHRIGPRTRLELERVVVNDGDDGPSESHELPRFRAWCCLS